MIFLYLLEPPPKKMFLGKACLQSLSLSQVLANSVVGCAPTIISSFLRHWSWSVAVACEVFISKSVY